MKQELIENTYKSIDELTENEKQKAYEDWLASDSCYWHGNSWDSDWRKTLDEFSKAFGVDVVGWKVSDYSYYAGQIDLDYCMDQLDEMNNPIRIAKYIYNNFSRTLYKPKYIGWHNGKHNAHYSKVQKNADCNLTGYCADWDIMKPLYNCVEYRTEYTSLQELFEDCIDGFFSAWQKDKEYLTSFEGFIEWAECNEKQFLTESKTIAA